MCCLSALVCQLCSLEQRLRMSAEPSTLFANWRFKHSQTFFGVYTLRIGDNSFFYGRVGGKLVFFEKKTRRLRPVVYSINKHNAVGTFFIEFASSTHIWRPRQRPNDVYLEILQRVEVSGFAKTGETITESCMIKICCIGSHAARARVLAIFWPSSSQRMLQI